MTEEEAIDILRMFIAECNDDLNNEISLKTNGITKKSIETVIKKYEKQQSELEKKDKQINELEDIFYNYQLCEYELTDCTYRKCEYITDDEIPPCKECIKQYFERKVK